MPTPPEGFLRSLQNLDSQLALRWGEATGKWVVERKAVQIPQIERQALWNRRERLHRLCKANPQDAKLRAKLNDVIEDYRSIERGYRVILSAADLTPQIFDALCLADIQRYGGYSRYCDELERAEEQREEAMDRAQAGAREDAAKEMFDQMNFIERKKLSRMITGRKSYRDLLHG